MKINISDYDTDGKRDVDVDISGHDLYSLDHTLALIIHPALVAYKEKAAGHPGGITQDEWDDILDKMIFAFERYTEDDFIYTNDEDHKKMSEGMKLFAEWYHHLWF